jgi:hypothetical protein
MVTDNRIRLTGLLPENPAMRGFPTSAVPSVHVRCRSGALRPAASERHVADGELDLLERARPFERIDGCLQPDAMRRALFHLDTLLEPHEAVDEEVVERQRVVVAEVDVALTEDDRLELLAGPRA